MFAIFAIFAKFAIFDPALEHPTLIYRQAPRVRSMSRCAFSTLHSLSCAQGEGLPTAPMKSRFAL